MEPGQHVEPEPPPPPQPQADPCDMANARAIVEDKDLKFLFVGGKGGVGKTTTSSSIACQLAYDRKVLLISTDPAHSLSDAFRLDFGNGEPHEIPGVPNLHVMEVNPETNLKDEIQAWAEMAQQAGMDELTSKVSEFQEWLSGVPGIDEATALTSVIGHIESGTYDTIVFDTAPTGHTLKLLQLPAILQAGLDKLQSWQAKIWDVWSVMKAGASAMAGDAPALSPAEMKKTVQDKLEACECSRPLCVFFRSLKQAAAQIRPAWLRSATSSRISPPPTF